MKVLRQFTCMAAIAVMTAFLGACSSDNDVAGINDNNFSNVRTITFTAGPLGGDAETRATLTDTGTKVTSSWAKNDVVGVMYKSGGVKKYTTGKVTAVTDGKATISASIEGTLDDGDFTINFPAIGYDEYDSYVNGLLNNQKGTLADIQTNWVRFIGSATVSGGAFPTDIEMKPFSTIWKLNFVCNGTDITSSITEVLINWKDGSYSFAFTVKPSSQSAIYVCLSDTYTPRTEAGKITITAKTATNTYVLTKTIAKDFVWGKVYRSTLTFTDLSALTDEYTAKDGETLTGTLGEKVKLNVAAGAKVTLSDVTINGTKDSYCIWSGINCQGDATIVLVGNNTVMGSHNGAGIHVPTGSTLTIEGDGSLTAGTRDWGAGIGAGYSTHPCGNIVIKGGTITATGGERFAGIGGGDQSDTCGDITINGGTVIATGGKYAAGIGTGWGSNSSHSKCGNITIGSGVTKVVANKGAGAPFSIGKGYSYENASNEYSECGTITIGGDVKDQNDFTGASFTYEP